MSDSSTLANHVLIAMPGLRDANFSRGVVLICQHGEEGAMGILVNRLSEYRLGDVLGQMNMASESPEIASMPVLIGGPVQPERGFVLHTRSDAAWESAFAISDDVAIATSRDILVAIAAGSGPRSSLVALGYASWAPGQLEQELRENTWLTAPATPDLLFATPLEERWNAAAQLLGVDPDKLALYAGHA